MCLNQCDIFDIIFLSFYITAVVSNFAKKMQNGNNSSC